MGGYDEEEDMLSKFKEPASEAERIDLLCMASRLDSAGCEVAWDGYTPSSRAVAEQKS